LKEKKENYSKNIVYLENSELVFDYLRDNMAYDLDEQVIKNNFNYTIIDEIDSILIDDAKNPIIISEIKKDNLNKFNVYAKIANQLKPVIKNKKEKS
jgi:preprotein translocase subunit SecA